RGWARGRDASRPRASWRERRERRAASDLPREAPLGEERSHAMIGVSKLAKAFGDRTLFEEASFQLNAGSRYGLVGANGSGKTTFLKIVAGAEPATDGSVAIPKSARVSVLRQDRFLDDDALVLDLTMMGDALVWRALETQRRIERGEGDPAALHDVEDVLR